MDWSLAIEKNREALKRVLAMLFAMVASGDGESPTGARPSTLPRHLHRFVLRLLRPAEAAARRLIIVAARGLVVELVPPRTAKPRPKPPLNRRNGYGTGIVIRPGPLPEWAVALAPRRSPAKSLPLLDPLKRFGARRRYVKPGAAPRIRSLDDPRIGLFAPPRAPDPPPPSPDDPLDARRLQHRLNALASALDDLPRQAKRLARWRARRDAGLARERDGYEAPSSQSESRGAAAGKNARRIQRLEPMRPGRPPGWQRKPSHAVDDVLNELHGLAVWVRERQDTS